MCWRFLRGSVSHLNRISRHALGFALKLVLAGYFIFCALLLVLRYAVLPEIGQYKPQIEDMATRAVGRAVTIDRIEAAWRGLRPALALTNLTVHDAEGNPALSLPRVSAELSWRSLLVAGLRLENLTIERADLSIRRDAAGQLHVAGIPVSAGADSGMLDWVLSQREIVIRNSRVRWHDEQRAAPELALSQVDLVLHNHWLRHQLALRAVPPAAYAAPLDIRADFAHPAFSRHIADVSRWKGTLYADLRQTDLAAWRAWIDYPIDITQGNGAVRAWLELDHAKVANFTADLALSDVSARLGRQLEPLALKQVQGRMAASESLGATPEDGIPTFGTNGHKLQFTDFSITMPDGFALPPTSIAESYEPGTALQPERTSVKASYLNLETLSQLATRLPLPPSQRKLLDDLAPRGELRDFAVQWQGTYPEVTSYRLQGQFAHLSMKAQAPHLRGATPASRAPAARQAEPAQWAAMPGFENLTGEIDATEKGGTLQLASRDLAVQLPAQVFITPRLLFDRLDMRARWQYQKDQTLTVEVEDMQFAQPGVVGRLHGKHVLPLQGDALGEVDLSGELEQFDVKAVRRFLTHGMSEPLRRWLSDGLVDGTARHVQVRLKGPLEDLPFAARAGEKPAGQLLVAGDFDGLKLNYTPGHVNRDGREPEWPLLENGRGKFSFDRASMEIKADGATTLGAKLGPVSARIADLDSHEAALEIEGQASGPMATFLQYARQSPVARWTGHALEQASASGEARLDLDFRMPLNHAIDTTANGVFHFANNDVDLLPDLPLVLRTNGKVEFNERGFNLNGVRGQFLGDTVALSGGTQQDGSTQVRLDGALSVEGLRRLYPEPAVQRLLARMEGATRYTANVLVRQQHPEVVVESNLAGLGLALPAPLNKAAQESLPLRVELAPLASNDPLMQREEIRVALGTDLAARYVRQKVTDSADDWRVVSGGIGYRQPAPTPASGVKLALAAPVLDVDAWEAFKTAIAGQAGEPGGDKLASSDIGQYLDVDAVTARIGELGLLDKKFRQVVLDATRRGNVWQMKVASTQATGDLTWDMPGVSVGAAGGRGSAGKLTARLSSLVIPKGEGDATADAGRANARAAADNAMQMPALDIRAEQFELAGKPLGKLELDASNIRTAAGREWRIHHLTLDNDAATLRAAGNWQASGNDNISSITYALDLHDAGKLLERFGYAEAVRGGHGKLDGDLSWQGLPYALDTNTLSGQVHVDVHGGQFLKVDPGAAKLLGVLNLQALPRRLTLDFRDVFSEGFAFDNVVGTASIRQGIATTDNLKITGVTASVLMNGSADIGRETQDLHVVVIPDINLGTASVVALAINPVVGVGTLLAQLFLRNPVMKSLSFEYKVTGPWSDPVVLKESGKSHGGDATSAPAAAPADAAP